MTFDRPAWTARLERASDACLWLFGAVALLSIAAQNVLFLGIAAWLAAAWLKRERGALALPGPLGFYLLFLAWALLAAFLAENQAHTLATYKRWLLVVAAWYAAQAVRERATLKAVLGSLLFFSALWCLGASLIALSKPLAAWAGGQAWPEVARRWLDMGDWRAVSGSGGYMVLGTGSMLLLLLFSGLALSDPFWRRPLPLACLAALGLGLLLTLTRSAWLGAAAGAALLLLWTRPRWALAVAGAALLLGLAFPGSLPVQRLRQGLDLRHDSTLERVYMARAGLGIIREHPWFGVGDSLETFTRRAPGGGAETVPGAYLRYRPAEASRHPVFKDREQGHLHNNLIMLAVMAGLPALFFMLLTHGALALAAVRAASSADPLAAGLAKGFAAALLAWWVNGLFEFNFASFQSSFTLWTLAGIFLAGRRLAGQDPQKG